jgi:hypothetical protein
MLRREETLREETLREETLREETLETPSQCERVRFPVDFLFRSFLGVTLVDHAVPPMELDHW